MVYLGIRVGVGCLLRGETPAQTRPPAAPASAPKHPAIRVRVHQLHCGNGGRHQGATACLPWALSHLSNVGLPTVFAQVNSITEEAVLFPSQGEPFE